MKILISLMILLASLTAHADDKKKKTYRKTQEVSFEAADVDGQVRTPDGAYVHQKKGIKFLPVYKVEQRFDKKIKESVEYMR